MPQPAEPIRLTRADLPRAAAMLSRAFAADPFANCMFPDAATRPQYFAKTTACVLRYGAAYGEVQAPSPQLEGVAVWFPPARVTASWWDMLRFGMYWLPFSIGWGAMRVILSYADHVERMRARHLRGPHWLLQLLGVDPDHRGAGHGACLLRSMLARLDAEGTPCCLDTENENNVPLYEHFGFRVLESSLIPGTACPCWLMARGVGGATASSEPP